MFEAQVFACKCLEFYYVYFLCFSWECVSVTLAAPPNSKMSMCGSLLQESWRLHSLEPLILYKWMRIVQLTHLSMMLLLPRHHQQCVYVCSYRQGEENTCTHTRTHEYHTHTHTHTRTHARKYAYMHAFMLFCQIYPHTQTSCNIGEAAWNCFFNFYSGCFVCTDTVVFWRSTVVLGDGRYSGVLNGYCSIRWWWIDTVVFWRGTVVLMDRFSGVLEGYCGVDWWWIDTVVFWRGTVVLIDDG